jgi:phage terminase Nu1 subunit (DNA packaging protein)
LSIPDTITISKFAELTKLSRNTVRYWKESEPNFPDPLPGTGNYQTVDLLRFWASLQGRERDALRDAEVRLKTAQANRTELQAEQAAGALVLASEVESTWSSYIANCRAKLLSIPSKIAPELSGLDDPTDCQTLLTTVLHDALSELAKDLDHAQDQTADLDS